MLCKLTRFYPAYKIDDLANLPKRTLDIMWECITVIEAQDQLKSFNISDWPNMKKAQRQKLHKELYRQAYPASLRKKNKITADDFAKMLGGG